MKILIMLIFSFLASCTNHHYIVEQPAPQISIDTFAIPNTTIRALHVVSDQQLWFAGSNGKYGYTLDGGKTWKIDSLEFQGKKPDFRSIALAKSGEVFLVSVAKPAALFKASIANLKWCVVYEDTAKDAFFDMVKFKDNNNGILLGDPKNGCFHVAQTKDGGEVWNKLECNILPKSMDKEAPFAASNSNMEYLGTNIWFGTGGNSGSRIYHSKNAGLSWTVYATPMVKGGAMTGTYSIDFYDQKRGVIAGGNWDSVKEITANLALTSDGGKTWELQDTGLPYISCVQFVPNSNAQELILLSGRGRPGPSKLFYIYKDNGFRFEYPNTNYLNIQFANDSLAWLSGRNKIGKMHIQTYPFKRYKGYN